MIWVYMAFAVVMTLVGVSIDLDLRRVRRRDGLRGVRCVVPAPADNQGRAMEEHTTRAMRIKAEHPAYFRACLSGYIESGVIKRRGRLWWKRLYIRSRPNPVSDVEAFASAASGEWAV